MQYYQTKAEKITGSSFNEMRKKAERIFDEIKKKSKRKPYIRSVYFSKSKIFLDYFWEHLYAKQNRRDKIRRIQFYTAALELIRNSRIHILNQKRTLIIGTKYFTDSKEKAEKGLGL